MYAAYRLRFLLLLLLPSLGFHPLDRPPWPRAPQPASGAPLAVLADPAASPPGLAVAAGHVLVAQAERAAPRARAQAEALVTEANQAVSRGEYEAAHRKLTAAFNLYRDLGDAEGMLWVGSERGVVYQEQGDDDKARQNYQVVLQFSQAAHYRRTEAHAWYLLGQLLYIQGEDDQAVAHYRQALDISKEIHDQLGEARARFRLGAVFEELGQYDAAFGFFQEAWAISEELQAWAISQALPDAPQHLLWSLQEALQRHLGLIYVAQGEYGKADEALKKARDTSQRLGNRQAEARVVTLQGLMSEARGRDAEAQGQERQARAQYTEALKTFKEGLRLSHDSQDHEGEGLALLHLSRLSNRLGQPTEAQQYAQQALRRSQTPGEQQALWRSHYELAQALEAQGQSDAALGHYHTAIATLEAIRGGIRGAEGQTEWLARTSFVYRDIVTLLLTLHQREPTRDYDRQAFQYVERGKARAFLDQLAEAGAGFRPGTAPDSLAREQKLYSQIAGAHRRLAAAQAAAHKKTPTQTEVQKKITDAQQEIRAFEAQLATVRQEQYQQRPQAAALQYLPPLTADAVQKLPLLDDGAVLLEYFWGRKALYLFVIDRTHFQALTLPVREPELVESLWQFLTPFRPLPVEVEKDQQDVQAFITRLQGFDLQRAYTLYRQLVQPAVRSLDTAHPLVIVPDSFLHYLPFELLVTAEVPTPPVETRVAFAVHRQVPYLVKQYTVVYAPSASVLRPEALGHAPRKPGPPKGLLALAPFGVTNRQDLAPVLQQIAQWLPQAGVPRPVAQAVTQKLQPLPGSRAEVQAITQLKQLRPEPPVVGPQATADLLRREAKHYRYVHVSTHGAIDGNYPLASGLLFPDMLLQTYQIFDLELHAELVVLSACETGVGPVRLGEGLVGLTRAFMYAGTPSVVASWWAVQDQATALLMTTFYQHVPQMPKGQALRQAKLALLTEADKQGTWVDTQGQKVTVAYAHPYFWAAFGLFGAWR